MVNKVIFNSYDAYNGETYLIIKNKYGIFDGTSRKSPKDDFSSFAGWDCAESKAVMQCYREQKSKAKLKLQALQNCYNALASVKDIDLKSTEMRRFRKQLHIAEKEVEAWDERIEAEKKNFWQIVNNHSKVAAKVKKHKEAIEALRATKYTHKNDE